MASHSQASTALGWQVGLSLRDLCCFLTGANRVGLVSAAQLLLVCLFVVLCGRAECVPIVFVLAFWCQELE